MASEEGRLTGNPCIQENRGQRADPDPRLRFPDPVFADLVAIAPLSHPIPFRTRS